MYDGQNLVAEKDSSGHVKVSYTNGKSNVISRTTWTVTTSGGTTTNAPDSTIFYLYDGSGNVNAIVDDNGALLKRIDYDVFGAERATGYDSGANNANAESNRMKFSGAVGHVGEPDFGLVYMRARYYDPALGRFISEDLVYNGPNWYHYCSNNSVNAMDPTGLFTFADVTTGAVEEASEEVGDYMSSKGCADWMQQKIINAVAEWADKYRILGEEVTEFGPAREGFDIAGGDGYRFMLHLAGHGGGEAAAHIQMTYWGTILKWIEVSEL